MTTNADYLLIYASPHFRLALIPTWHLTFWSEEWFVQINPDQQQQQHRQQQQQQQQKQNFSSSTLKPDHWSLISLLKSTPQMFLCLKVILVCCISFLNIGWSWLVAITSGVGMGKSVDTRVVNCPLYLYLFDKHEINKG